MKKKLLLTITSCVLAGLMMVGCGTTAAKEGKKDYDKITIVWYPNESGGDLAEARDEIGKVVTEATGKQVEHKLTTDYAIAIEAITSDNAQLAFMGAQGYVEAHGKNDKVIPLVVASGKSGTLDDAVYYSWLAAKTDFKLEDLKGKRMSFVSNSSTSGFKVPSQTIGKKFGVETEGLMEGGKDKFFSEVLYGGSHQGAAVNLLNDKVDVAAFCDTVMYNYIDLVSGEFNKPGAEYKIKDNAEDPFTNLKGEKFKVFSSTPVLNSPFVMNSNNLTDEDQTKLFEAFTSDKVNSNEKVFVPKGAEFKGFFTKEGNEKFLKVEDAWFNPIRDMK